MIVFAFAGTRTTAQVCNHAGIIVVRTCVDIERKYVKYSDDDTQTRLLLLPAQRRCCF